ncbi:MAG TPA: 5-(carboxyamino)imidazole ribonucleotide mutase [Pseudobdellovibrionaceae bacterium]|nr:5-(carboxyamino)imidazole ribonucleotide mutase [Pseudobdellovibrionaceae bacterium]
MKIKPVVIVMGSSTDLKVMKESQAVLKTYQIKSEIKIISAHRTPEEMVQFAKTADQKYSVIIAGAGGAAHLPGMIASLTVLPVIGVPVAIGKLKGLDALLSVVQMPKGVPVATVAIDNATNAGHLAARILGVFNLKIQKKITQHQRNQIKHVRKMRKALS